MHEIVSPQLKMFLTGPFEFALVNGSFAAFFIPDKKPNDNFDINIADFLELFVRSLPCFYACISHLLIRLVLFKFRHERALLHYQEGKVNKIEGGLIRPVGICYNQFPDYFTKEAKIDKETHYFNRAVSRLFVPDRGGESR